MAADMTRHQRALLEMRRGQTRAMHGHKEFDAWALIQHRKLVQVFSPKAMLEPVKQVTSSVSLVNNISLFPCPFAPDTLGLPHSVSYG